MSAFEEQPVVGLFGTCGSSTFRQDLFIPRLEEEGIPYFNPQLGPGEWNPEFVPVEADHLAYDTVQLWPVTGETYGTGSLAEQGYSIASSLRAPSPLPKYVIAMIEQELDPELDDAVARKESLRARALAAGHLALSSSDRLRVVNTLEEMVEVGVNLFRSVENEVDSLRRYNPSYRRFVEGRAEAEQYRSAIESGQLGADVARLAE